MSRTMLRRPLPARRRVRLLLALAASVLSLAAALVAPTSADAAAPTCGGQMIYKSPGVRWVCTFDDEFTGTTLDTSKWTVQQTATSGFTTGPVTSLACYLNSKNNVYVSGGDLHLVARKEAAPFICGGAFRTQYTSGEVSTIGKFSQTYGRFDIRAKFPATTVQGLQETLWLWPNNDTKYGAEPASGEIDIAENYSQHANINLPYIHYNSAEADANVTNYGCKLSSIYAFHLYSLVWTPTTLTISYDNKTCLVDQWHPAAPLVAPEPFNQPFFMILTQALGFGTNAFVPGTTPMPASTLIDYVRIWK